MNILLIEDDSDIVEFIRMEMKHEGYRTMHANNGIDGLELALSGTCDLVLLDIMLPGMNGLEVLRRLRAASSVPVIMLTARDSVIDKVTGLDGGANDYLTKPFHIEELLARIRVLTRETAPQQIDILEAGRITLFRKQRVVEADGDAITMTKTEFDLLEYFMLNPDIVLSREQLLNAVWGYSYIGDSNIVDVYVRYVRKRLKEHACDKLIESVRGIGYVLRKKSLD